MKARRERGDTKKNFRELSSRVTL